MRPRDQLKLGQVMLGGGPWKGKPRYPRVRARLAKQADMLARSARPKRGQSSKNSAFLAKILKDTRDGIATLDAAAKRFDLLQGRR